MTFDILTLFPEAVESMLGISIIGMLSSRQ